MYRSVPTAAMSGLMAPVSIDGPRDEKLATVLYVWALIAYSVGSMVTTAPGCCPM